MNPFFNFFIDVDSNSALTIEAVEIDDCSLEMIPSILTGTIFSLSFGTTLEIGDLIIKNSEFDAIDIVSTIGTAKIDNLIIHDNSFGSKNQACYGFYGSDTSYEVGNITFRDNSIKVEGNQGWLFYLEGESSFDLTGTATMTENNIEGEKTTFSMFQLAGSSGSANINEVEIDGDTYVANGLQKIFIVYSEFSTLSIGTISVNDIDTTTEYTPLPSYFIVVEVYSGDVEIDSLQMSNSEALSNSALLRAFSSSSIVLNNLEIDGNFFDEMSQHLVQANSGSDVEIK